jgi:hypothetical protein
MDLPVMEHDGATIVPDMAELAAPVVLDGMDYMLARAIPGAEWSREHHAMVLPAPTARDAMVALTLMPTLANDHPELVELRDTLIQNVRPTDHATRLQIKIDAPIVHKSLLDEGHDWLEFDHEVNEPVGDYWPRQDTDLGYIAAIVDKHGAAGLGWSRGYGKTLGTAAIAEANGYRSVLVAAPNSAKADTWAQELAHRRPDAQVLIFPDSGTSSYQRKQAAVLKRAQELAKTGRPFFLVIHHEGVVKVAGTQDRKSGKGKTVMNGWQKLGIKWDLFAYDESHTLKNAGRDGSLRHRAALKVTAKHRLALTGSIFENSWEELYGTLHWLYPTRYKNQWVDWNNRFFDYVDGYGKVWVGILEGREQAMADELGVFWVVREKVSRAIELEQLVDLSPGQQKAYDELLNVLLTQLEDGTLVGADAGVVQLTRLRQVASGLELLTKNLADSTKLDRTMKVISEYEDFDDFFVAAWYKASAYGLRDRLREAGYIHVFVVTGDMSATDRGATIKLAREAAANRQMRWDDQPVILIGTIATMGQSVNLQFLNHVIRLDRSFNPAENRQVLDRLDRTGQKRQARATDIVARNTVDQLVVMPNLKNKDAARAQILGRGA